MTTSIHASTDDEGTTSVHWQASDGRGLVLVILSDGDAHYSVKASQADHYALDARPIEWPQGMKIALDQLNA